MYKKENRGGLEDSRMKNKKTKKDNRWKRFLKWIENASKKDPPKCGGNCCK